MICAVKICLNTVALLCEFSNLPVATAAAYSSGLQLAKRPFLPPN
jgi:hypothetical protein